MTEQPTAPSPLARHLALEARYDGLAPWPQLQPPPARAQPSGSAYLLTARIARRRAGLPADRAATDRTLQRLQRHLAWLRSAAAGRQGSEG